MLCSSDKKKIVIFLLHKVLLFVFSRIPRKLFKWASAQASLFCPLTVSYSLAFCLVFSSDEEDHTHSHRVLSTPPAIYYCRAFISPSNPMGQGLLSWMPGKWHNSLYLNYYHFFYFQQHSSHLNYDDFFFFQHHRTSSKYKCKDSSWCEKQNSCTSP